MKKRFHGFEKKNIVVIGDMIADIYFYGATNRISPEAPVPVFLKESETMTLGGAANVAMNLISAGQNVHLISRVGKDEIGKKVLKILRKEGIDYSSVIIDGENTTNKTRFIANNNQQILRMDIERCEDISEEKAKIVIREFCSKLPHIDAVIISDYMKGFLSEYLCRSIINIANKNGIPILTDVKGNSIGKYYGSFIIKPNKKELSVLTGSIINNYDEVIRQSKLLRKKAKCKFVLTTLGPEGMVLVGNNKEYKVESENHEVYDVTGAGDTTIAYVASCIANGYNVNDAVYIANCAAGLKVKKLGTVPVGIDELCLYINSKYNDKSLSEDDLKSFRQKNRDKSIVFTNGCFDILHTGHISLLKKASMLGDYLVIGINGDDSVKRLKGRARPINHIKDRVEMLSAFDFVNKIVIFDEDTPLKIIKKLKPDVLVKGGDYSINEIVGAEFVKNNGGKVVILPYVKGKSTSNIIKKTNRK